MNQLKYFGNKIKYDNHIFVEYLKSISNSLNKEELSRLDGWRGFLAFIVVIAHSIQIFIDPIIGLENYFCYTIAILAHSSVLGFFIISGIAITMSLVSNINRNRNTINYREYVIARVARIYPPLLFSVFLCCLFLCVMMYFNLLGINESYKLNTDLYIAREYFNFSLKDVIKTLNFSDVRLVKVNGPLWSLIYEWWLYFFGLFLVGIFFAKNTILQIISLILLLLVYNKIEQLHGLIYIVIWMLGFVFFTIGKTRIKWNNLLVFIAVFGLIACNYFLNFIQNKTDITTLPIVQILISILFLGIIFKFPKSSIFNKVSNFSYTLYIIHFPIFLFFLSLFHKSTYNSMFLSIILSFFSIATVLVISHKVYIYIENKKYFTGLINNLLLSLSNLFSTLSKNIKSKLSRMLNLKM